MLRDNRPLISEDGADDSSIWRERSNYWRNYRPKSKGPSKKFHFREPLILCGHGAKIRVDQNTLLVRGGFTHYPQKADEHRFFPGDANLPDRIVIIDGSGGLSFHAIAWMAEQNIELVQLSWRGEATSISPKPGYSANSELSDFQRQIRNSNGKIEIVRGLICEKLRASVQTLRDVIPISDKSQNAVGQIQKWILQLENPKIANSISRVLGIEGPAAKVYFQTWQGIPLNWKGLAHKPIPRDWLEIGPRMMSWRKRARAARHPVNAMLNYGYGLLKAKVRAQLVASGFDPTVGFMHGNSSSTVPLVYDVMEPLRPVVDAKVLQFAIANTFVPDDFTINRIGACRLNPEMARAVISAVNVSAEPVVRSLKKLIRGT